MRDAAEEKAERIFIRELRGRESEGSALEARLNVFTRAFRRQLHATGTASDVEVALGCIGCYAGPL